MNFFGRNHFLEKNKFSGGKTDFFCNLTLVGLGPGHDKNDDFVHLTYYVGYVERITLT